MPRRKKGVTFRLKKAFLSRFKNKDVIVEFYLPRDFMCWMHDLLLKRPKSLQRRRFCSKNRKRNVGRLFFCLGRAKKSRQQRTIAFGQSQLLSLHKLVYPVLHKLVYSDDGHRRRTRHGRRTLSGRRDLNPQHPRLILSRPSAADSRAFGYR